MVVIVVIIIGRVPRPRAIDPRGERVVVVTIAVVAIVTVVTTVTASHTPASSSINHHQSSSERTTEHAYSSTGRLHYEYTHYDLLYIHTPPDARRKTHSVPDDGRARRRSSTDERRMTTERE